MSRILNDVEGDSLRIEEASPPYKGVVLSATQRDSGGTVHHAIIGPLDPHKLIEAIKAECELHEDDEVHDSPVVESVAEQINKGIATRIDFPQGDPADAAIENVVEDPEEDPAESSPRVAVHRMPATAEEPRLWAGTDEPIIDQLIGRVADLEEEGRDAAQRVLEEPSAAEDAHQYLADHWDRRMDVVKRALTMIPAPGKRGGLAAAFAGEEIEQFDRIEKALKIARFAADEDRDIPGVDR